MSLRRLLCLGLVVGLLFSIPLTAGAQSRSRGSEVDIAVTEISAPDIASTGQTVSIEALITATGGGRATTADVELSVSPGGGTQTEQIVISDGETKAVPFDWTPGSPGSHTASVNVSANNDPDTSNNSGSAEIEVIAANGPFVSGFSSSVEGANLINGTVELSTGDSARSRSRRGGGISSADVTIEYTTPDGRSGMTTATTGADGAASFEIPVEGTGSVPNCYTVAVTDVSKSGFEYNTTSFPDETIYPKPAAIYATEFDSDNPADSRLVKLDMAGNVIAEGSQGLIYFGGIVTSLDGRVFVVDALNYTIHIFDGDLNQIDSFSISQAGEPFGLAIDSEGVLYVSYYGPINTVIKYDQSGNQVGPDWPDQTLTNAYDLTVGPDDLVYVADANAPDGNVKVFERDGTLVGSFSTPSAASSDEFAQDVTFDCNGNLYVSAADFNAGSGAVYVYGPDGTHQRTIGDQVLGDAVSVLVGGSSQTIYVTDFFAESIELFDQEGNHLKTFGGGYQPLYLSFAY